MSSRPAHREAATAGSKLACEPGKRCCLVRGRASDMHAGESGTVARPSAIKRSLIMYLTMYLTPGLPVRFTVRFTIAS